MTETDFVTIKPVTTKEDGDWLQELWTEEWGGDTMIVGGKTYRLAQLHGLIAWYQRHRVGAATVFVHTQNQTCELMSLNATKSGKGVGTLLLEEVERFAVTRRCKTVKIITSNDNLDALKFYQKRGYRLVAVYRGAVDQARKLKPKIPLVANNGIPLHDELELAKGLS